MLIVGIYPTPLIALINTAMTGVVAHMDQIAAAVHLLPFKG
jgi:hypothetical protein